MTTNRAAFDLRNPDCRRNALRRLRFIWCSLTELVRLCYIDTRDRVCSPAPKEGGRK